MTLRISRCAWPGVAAWVVTQLQLQDRGLRVREGYIHTATSRLHEFPVVDCRNGKRENSVQKSGCNMEGQRGRGGEGERKSGVLRASSRNPGPHLVDGLAGWM